MYMTKLGQLAIQSKTLHDFFINRSPNHTLYQTAGITWSLSIIIKDMAQCAS